MDTSDGEPLPSRPCLGDCRELLLSLSSSGRKSVAEASGSAAATSTAAEYRLASAIASGLQWQPLCPKRNRKGRGLGLRGCREAAHQMGGRRNSPATLVKHWTVLTGDIGRGTRQGKTRQRSRPLSQWGASQDRQSIKPARSERWMDVGQRLAEDVLGRPRGLMIGCTGSRMNKTHVCKRATCPDFFDDGEKGCLCPGSGSGSGSVSVTEGGGQNCWNSQLREDLGQRLGSTRTKPQTKTGTYGTYGHCACLDQSMPGGDARRRKREAVHERL